MSGCTYKTYAACYGDRRFQQHCMGKGPYKYSKKQNLLFTWLSEGYWAICADVLAHLGIKSSLVPFAFSDSGCTSPLIELSVAHSAGTKSTGWETKLHVNGCAFYYHIDYINFN